jgi:hypothetical protein
MSMADEAEDEEPIVELGEGESVKGAPIRQVTARLYFGIEHSEVIRREGETQVRTPSGPRSLSDVLSEVETTYFETRRDLEHTIETTIDTGVVPTADE